MKVSSIEFQQNVGPYQDEVILKGRVARRVEDLDEATIKAIEAAEVPAEYAHLDDLVKSR